MKRILLLIVIAGFFILRAQAQQVAVKTNALMWGLMSPNLGCELVTGERTSVELSVFGNYKPFGKDMNDRCTARISVLVQRTSHDS